MIRTISHTEVSTALDCFAKHAFAYTGALTDGSALESKRSAPLLRDGKAWGAGVAAYHAGGSAQTALIRSLQDDQDQMLAYGLADDEEFAGAVNRLSLMLDQYTRTVERLPLIDTEHELMVALPSRRSARASTRYRLRCFLDGVHLDEEGRYWIVEFKLRNRLQSDELIALSRQTRWYAWAWRRHTGMEPAGVIVDERLNALPAAVRTNRDGSISKVQSCLPEAYVLACEREAQTPDSEVLSQLRVKQWQKRTTIMFRAAELEEAGWQLASAANLVRQLDSGVLFPIRNPSPARCPSCQYREICDTPSDTTLVDSLFVRVLPKRSRDLTDLEAAA